MQCVKHVHVLWELQANDPWNNNKYQSIVQSVNSFLNESTSAFRVQNSSHLYVYVELRLHSNVHMARSDK